MEPNVSPSRNEHEPTGIYVNARTATAVRDRPRSARTSKPPDKVVGSGYARHLRALNTSRRAPLSEASTRDCPIQGSK